MQESNGNGLIAAALYKFVSLPDCIALRGPLQAYCDRHDLKGTLLLAPEGINGTVAGTRAAIDALLAYLRSDPRLADLDHKESPASKLPFRRMRVRVKREIVTLGVPVDPTNDVGRYVKPSDWNALLDDPDVLVIDTRNDYEVALGTFQGAVNPGIKTFRDLPQWLASDARLAARPKVAMFCTGGIRCEKSTAWLRRQGFAEVYHLQGGILKYLEEIPESASRWEGECFVFDERVTLGQGLRKSERELCRTCCRPIDADDRRSSKFVEGYSCPRCFDDMPAHKQDSLRERKRQDMLTMRREG